MYFNTLAYTALYRHPTLQHIPRYFLAMLLSNYCAYKNGVLILSRHFLIFIISFSIYPQQNQIFQYSLKPSRIKVEASLDQFPVFKSLLTQLLMG